MATAPQAWSQVVVRMTTTQQTPCTATTDANGLRLVPGSTDLQATGVTLAGAGCGLQGSGESYQVAVTAGNATTKSVQRYLDGIIGCQILFYGPRFRV